MNDTVITVTGNLVTMPFRRLLDSGASVTSFRMASTARRFDPDTKGWVDANSFYVRVSCWRQLADNVARSLVKGDPVVVQGRISTHNFEVDGQKRSSTEIEALAVGPDLTWGQADFHRIRRESTPGPEMAVTEDEDEELGIEPDEEFAAGATEHPVPDAPHLVPVLA